MSSISFKTLQIVWERKFLKKGCDERTRIADEQDASRWATERTAANQEKKKSLKQV